MTIESYVKDGKVAILISYGFGAGWSTWNSHDEFMLKDKGLVTLKLKGASDETVESYINSKMPEGSYFFMGGWDDVEVVWLDEGDKFIVNEYDGSESLLLRETMAWVTA